MSPDTAPAQAADLFDAMRRFEELPLEAPAVRDVPLAEALGRVLAADRIAPFAVPGFRRARLDGYAVRSRDLREASPERPARLRAVGSAPAGTWPVPAMGEGECVRIMTGAALPDRADAVVGFEDVLPGDGQTVLFPAPAEHGAAVGRPNADAARGEVLLKAGTRLLPVHLGRLAAVGDGEVRVFERPSVAVLGTGSELLVPGARPAQGKIFNSTGPVAAGLIRGAGALPMPLGVVPDDADAVAGALLAAKARGAAMLVSTGGVGGGDRDRTRAALAAAGAQILLPGAAFRPGGNFLLARLGATPVLALSGAPGSALLALHLLGLPLVRRLCGDRNWRIRRAQVALASLPKRRPLGILPGRLLLEEGSALLDPMTVLDMERSPLDLVLPLGGDEDLPALLEEQTPLDAFLIDDRNPE